MQYLYNKRFYEISVVNKQHPKGGQTKLILGQKIRDENTLKFKLEKLLSSKRVNKYVYDLQINQIKVEIKQKQKWTNILKKDIRMETYI